MRARLGTLATLVTIAVLVSGHATSQPLSSAELVRELSGNTLSGFNGSLWFSEYHAPDGRVFGRNGSVPVQDGCWTTRGNAVCYTYPRSGTRSTDSSLMEFCWNLERVGQEGYRLALVGQSSSGLARRQAGNPAGFSDNGHPWSCEAQVSRLDGRMTARTITRRYP